MRVVPHLVLRTTDTCGHYSLTFTEWSTKLVLLGPRANSLDRGKGPGTGDSPLDKS